MVDVDTGDRGPIELVCPRCSRVLAWLIFDGEHARLGGVVEAANGDPDGRLSTSEPGAPRIGATGRVVSADLAIPPGSASGLGRVRVECRSRRHRGGVIEGRTVTQATLDATYRRAAANGAVRVSLTDLCP